MWGRDSSIANSRLEKHKLRQASSSKLASCSLSRISTLTTYFTPPPLCASNFPEHKEVSHRWRSETHSSTLGLGILQSALCPQAAVETRRARAGVMVLARALASSRLTIGRRALRFPVASGISARPRESGHPRCLYSSLSSGGGGPLGNPDHEEDRLVKALGGLGEAKKLAAEGTPEERTRALASIEESKTLIKEATPEQRLRALAFIDESLRSLRSRQSQPVAKDPASAETIPEQQSGEGSNQGAAGAAALQEVPAPDIEESRQGVESADRPGWKGADAAQAAEGTKSTGGDSVSEQAGAESVEESRQEQEPASAPIWEAADDILWGAADTTTTDASHQGEARQNGLSAEEPAIENLEHSEHGKSPAVGPVLQEVPAEPESYSVDKWTAQALGESEDGTGLAHSPALAKILDEPPPDPEDPRKWELIEQGHPFYPDMTKEDRERLIIVRRTQTRTLLRRIDKVWLRNSCTCSHCVDSNTGWKNFNITSVPDELPTSLTRFNESTGDLVVHWDNDFLTGGKHKSVFPAELLEFLNRPRSKARARVQAKLSSQTKTLWDADKLKKNPIRAIDYRDWKKRGDAFNTVLESLHVQGLAIIRGTDKVTLEDVAAAMGPAKNTPWGSSWDAGFEPHPRYKDARDVAKGFTPRTHGPYLLQMPKLTLLQCLENKADGGETLLVDGLKTAYDLDEFDPTSFERLKTYAFRFRYLEKRKDGQSVVYYNRRPCVWPLMSGDMIIRINQETMTTDPLAGNADSDAFNNVRKALKAWEERIVDPSNVVEHKMRKGDCSTRYPLLSLLSP